MSKPDHDAIDAALIETVAQAIDEAVLRDYENSQNWDDAKDVVENLDYPALARAAVKAARLAIVPAGESAAGAARDMREAAARKAERLFNCGYVPGLDLEDITARDTGNQIAVAIRALPLPAPQPDQRDDLRALLVRAGEGMTSVRCTLAALIPNPSAPKTHEWPCENGADREYLQLAYEELTAALSAIRTATQTQETK